MLSCPGARCRPHDLDGTLSVCFELQVLPARRAAHNDGEYDLPAPLVLRRMALLPRESYRIVAHPAFAIDTRNVAGSSCQDHNETDMFAALADRPNRSRRSCRSLHLVFVLIPKHFFNCPADILNGRKHHLLQIRCRRHKRIHGGYASDRCIQ